MTRRIRSRQSALSSLTAVFPLVLAVAALAACEGPRTWQRVEADRGFGDVWNAFERVAANHGYRADPAGTDRGKREFQSRWRVAEGTLLGGERTRLHARFTRQDPPAPAWLLEFHVERQVSGDMRRRLDPEESDWETGGQDGQREEVMLGQLRLSFDQELGIVPTFDRERR